MQSQSRGPLRPGITVKPTTAANEALEIASVNAELLAAVIGNTDKIGVLMPGQFISVVNGICLRAHRFEKALRVLSAAFTALECGAENVLELLVTPASHYRAPLAAHLESSVLFGALVPPPVASGTHAYTESPHDPCVSIAVFARGALHDSNSHTAEAPLLGGDFLESTRTHDPKKHQLAEAMLVPQASRPVAISPDDDVAIGSRAFVPVPFPGVVIDRWFALDVPRGAASADRVAPISGVSPDCDVDRRVFEASQRRGCVYAAAARMPAGSSCPLSLMRSRLSAHSSEGVAAQVEAASSNEARRGGHEPSRSSTPDSAVPRIRLRISWVPLFMHRQALAVNENAHRDNGPAQEGDEQARGGADVLTADTRRVRAVVKGLSISLLDKQPREILLLTVSRVRALVNQGALQRIELDVGRLQLDCQLPFTSHPVVLAPAAQTIEAKRAARRARRHAAAERVKADAMRAIFAAAAARERASMAVGSSSAILGGSLLVPPPHFGTAAGAGEAVGFVDSEELPTLSILLITSPHPVITYVQLLSVRLVHLNLEADDVLLNALIDFGKEIANARAFLEMPAGRLLAAQHLLRMRFAASQATTKDPSGLSESRKARDALQALLIRASESVGASAPEGGESRVYFRRLQLHPVFLDLTFQLSGDVRLLSHVGLIPDMPMFGYVRNLVEALGTSLANIDHAPIRLPTFAHEYLFDANSVLASRLASHFIGYGLVQVYKVLGSSELVGNPVALLSNVGRDVKALLYDPAQGLLEAPSLMIARDFAENAVSLLRNTSIGIVESATKVIETVSKTIKKLNLDEGRKRGGASSSATVRIGVGAAGPRNLSEGLAQGASVFVREVGGGLIGIVLRPIEGARRSGALGAARGVAEGLLGLVTRTVTGTLDGVVLAARGAAHSVNPRPESTYRERFPRLISADGSVRAYSQREAEGAARLYVYKGGSTHAREYVYHARCVAVRFTESSRAGSDIATVARVLDAGLTDLGSQLQRDERAPVSSPFPEQTLSVNVPAGSSEDAVEVAQPPILLSTHTLSALVAIVGRDGVARDPTLPLFSAAALEITQEPMLLLTRRSQAVGQVARALVHASSETEALGRSLAALRRSAPMSDAGLALSVARQAFALAISDPPSARKPFLGQRQSAPRPDAALVAPPCPYVVLVTTLHVYVLHAKTNQRFLKLPLFSRRSEAADDAGGQEGGALVSASRLGELLARARGSGDVARSAAGDATSPQVPALSVNTLGVVLEVSVLAGRLAGRGVAILCSSAEEASLLRRAIASALRGVYEPARLVEAERAAAARQRAATRATLEALAVARSAQAQALLTEAAARATRLFRVRVVSVADEIALPHGSHARAHGSRAQASAMPHERAFVICASLYATTDDGRQSVPAEAAAAVVPWRGERHEEPHAKLAGEHDEHLVRDRHGEHEEQRDALRQGSKHEAAKRRSGEHKLEAAKGETGDLETARKLTGKHSHTVRHTRTFAAIADVWRRVPPALRGAPVLPAGRHADAVCAGLRALLEALKAEARAHEAGLRSATLLFLEAPPAPPSVTSEELRAAAEAVLEFLLGEGH